MSRRTHWERVYTTRPAEELGWYAPHLTTPLEWIGQLELDRDARVIDVGAGGSTLVDDLLDAGHRSVTVLDIAEPALQIARARLGERAQHVTWLNADITSVELPERQYALWHDRAVFHFLTARNDRRRYLDNLRRVLIPGGALIMGAFTPAAPPKCSGLPVQRYTAGTLADGLGGEFSLRRHREELHVTPAGVEQMFVFCEFRRG